MDIIFLNGMTVETLVGVYEWERQHKQKLIMDLEVGMVSQSQRHDELDNTISYADVAALVRETLLNQEFKLLESIAEHTATLLLSQKQVLQVKVKLVKPGILSGVKEVGVQIVRKKMA